MLDSGLLVLARQLFGICSKQLSGHFLTGFERSYDKWLALSTPFQNKKKCNCLGLGCLQIIVLIKKWFNLGNILAQKLWDAPTYCLYLASAQNTDPKNPIPLIAVLGWILSFRSYAQSTNKQFNVRLFLFLYVEDAQPGVWRWGTAQHVKTLVPATVHPCLRTCLSKTYT